MQVATEPDGGAALFGGCSSEARAAGFYPDARGFDSHCPHSLTGRYSHNMAEDRNAYMREYFKRRRWERKLIAIQRLGGRCSRCNTDENLTLQYIDPSTKGFDANRLPAVSEDRFEQEIPKMEVICPECVRYERILDDPCGTVTNYRRGCRCQPCRDANTAYNVSYNRTRRRLKA